MGCYSTGHGSVDQWVMVQWINGIGGSLVSGSVGQLISGSWVSGLDWIEQGLTAHSTYFSF